MSSPTNSKDAASKLKDGELAPEQAARRPSVIAGPPPPPRGPVVIELRDVELQKLHTIDVGMQRFAATIWMEFVIPDGARDGFLSAKGSVFPVDPTGKPLFRPSAEWFLEQIDFRSAFIFKTLDAKVMTRGDDLILAARYEGVFCEIYELELYPFDSQGCTLTLNFNCRCNGPLKLELRVRDDCRLAMTCTTICPPAKQWELKHEMRARPHLIGTGDRKFPAISLSAMVQRKPFYHIINMAVPFSCFSMLAVLQCTVWTVDSVNHRAQLSMMLVLTGAAYKMAISNKLPPIHYLTLLDKFTLLQSLIIILVATESRLLSALVERPGALDDVPEETLAMHDKETLAMHGYYDATFSASVAGLWVLVHAYFIFKGLLLCARPDRYNLDRKWLHEDCVKLVDHETREEVERESKEEREARKAVGRRTVSGENGTPSSSPTARGQSRWTMTRAKTRAIQLPSPQASESSPQASPQRL